MSFDAEAAFKQIQGQLDAIAAELSGIRTALHIDDREQAKSFLFWRIGEDGVRRRAFDTTAFFDAYHAKHGNGAIAPDGPITPTRVYVDESGESAEGATAETP